MSGDVDLIGTFTGPELERATGLPDRTVELLIRENLMLGRVTEPGRGRQARYSFRALSRMASIAALAPSTGGYVTAARIINEIAPALEAQYGSFPFGFSDMQRAVYAKLKTSEALRGPDREICPYRTIETAWRNGLEDERVKRPNDFVMLIIDGAFVGWTVARPLATEMPRAILRFEFRGKSGGFVSESLDTPEGDTLFAARLENAVSDHRLNIGLALRRAVVCAIKNREALT
ncbi:hypothetical protein ACTTAI_02670 [Rhodobacter capsulatus]|uniref:hypothetical protein n=1 Tax=Rhodobacter capsulatus TaxID=1061 RepID=UPI0040256D55